VAVQTLSGFRFAMGSSCAISSRVWMRREKTNRGQDRGHSKWGLRTRAAKRRAHRNLAMAVKWAKGLRMSRNSFCVREGERRGKGGKWDSGVGLNISVQTSGRVSRDDSLPTS
jgi:hypothetical protein